jgi:hypothetical protein
MYAVPAMMLVGSVGLVSNAAIAAAGPSAEQGVRFNSAGVLDLADRSQKIVAGRPVAVVDLPSEVAAEIFSAAEQGEAQPGLRFSDDEFGCAKPSRKCSLEQETKRLDAAGGAAKRDGKRLTITPANGAPVTFVDWKVAATKSADGDDETHWYLGRMPGPSRLPMTSGALGLLPGGSYHRVEVQFGHDAPGDFLINPQSGKVAFVHNGADIAAPSPDGKLLVTFNTLNPPPSIRVASLDPAGPRLTLQCDTPEASTRLTPIFKGWHDAQSFDLVFEIGEQSKSMVRLAMRLASSHGGWQIAAGDGARVAQIGFLCHDAADDP